MIFKKRSFVPFEETSMDVAGALLFLDIDGTLMPDGDKEISESVRKRLNELTAKNTVYLTTNSRNQKRKQFLTELIGIPLVPNENKKPWKSVLENISVQGKEMVVMGDKFLTDYLFAKHIGAQFFGVKRKRSYRERVVVRLMYLFDDLAVFLLHLFL